MVRNVEAYMVCVDCLMAAAGIAEEEMGHPYPTDPHPLRMIGRSASVHPGDSEHREDFSTAWCEGCGSTLAGERHEIVALYA